MNYSSDLLVALHSLQKNSKSLKRPYLDRIEQPWLEDNQTKPTSTAVLHSQRIAADTERL